MFEFRGFRIPEELVRMTGAGPESFGPISDRHIDVITELFGVGDGSSILEIGCGIGRDAIPLTKIIGKEGRYTGVDIIKRSLEWCSTNITPRHDNFRF